MRELYDLYTTVPPGWPPINVIVYNVLLAACCLYAFRRGGAPEKFGAAIIAVASLLSRALARGAPTAYQSINFGIFVVDVLCAAAFVVLAFRADRYWTLWAAALGLMAIAGHAMKYLEPDMVRRTYAFMIVIWSYLILLLIVVGTRRHQKRLARFNADRAWSPWKVGG